MTVTLLPNFRTLSEFGAYHGDCGETATLAALHALDPVGWPLTLAFLNAMVADELRQGLADPNLSGGQNIPSIDTYLTRRGIHHTTIGYAAFNLDQFHIQLKAYAGHNPVVVEWANAQALPGDESGVHFHYSTAGGLDTGPQGDGVGGAYLWADGDNWASTKADGGSSPIRYTWAQVVAAQPIGYIIVTQPPKEATVAWTQQSDGTGKDAQGHTCGAGMMAEIAAHGISADGRRSETYMGGLGPVKSFLTLTNGQVLTFDGSGVAYDGANVVEGLLASLNAAQHQPAPAPAVDPVKDRALAALQDLKAALAEL